MTSEANHEKTIAHHSTPAGGVSSDEHVEPSTKATEYVLSHKPQEASTVLPKPEETSEQDITHNSQRQPQQTESQEDVLPMVVVTESGPSGETQRRAEDVADHASAVSMPAFVPSSTEGAEGRSDSPMMTPVDKDTATVVSAPAVVVDVEGEVGSSELEDIMSSPHGNNAIVERSPGGRYVRFMEKLGSGASKDVYRAYDTQEGIEVAWNVVHLAGVPKNERNRIVNEVRLLERLHHHNIISFHGSWVNREKQQVNFVTEILSSGTLQSFINKVQVIRWKIAKRWALQILKGLEYLHSQDPPVIHRDLKCQNIFINGTSGDLRIGDLGLSTVHRNGKALSVLGTPEFMAPDMYEESAYDEKVDIYAFGMVLLEIFTKEIPYRECNNPAQIYKKVIRGDPPDSLRRLKSRHAREFIYLCLGSKDDDGNYIRPSATELLAHPFLQQRPSDDDEVEVEAPMQEKVIRELPETTSTGAKGVSKSARSESSKPAEGTSKTTISSPKNKLERQSSNTVDEDESDRFDEMPDSETSFRKPKVLMGRGQELKRESDDSNPEQQATGGLEVDVQGQVAPQAAPPPPLVAPAGNHTVLSEQQAAPTPVQSPASSFHFLVAAAVIEDEFSNSRPYEDDVLKLVVTLPVEGQTQNVQFDFHLVEDDPIQVAKEMVAELGIPQAAVLEISETISGLARAARIKQDKYIARMNKTAPGHIRARSQTQGGIPKSIDSMPPQPQTIGHGPNTTQSQSHPSIPDYMTAPPMQGQHGAPALHQQQPGIPPQDQPPHIQGQRAAMHMQPQHQAASDSLTSLPLNPQLQNQTIQSAGQNISQTDQTIQTAPTLIGHSQHQQTTWNPHAAQNAPPPADATMNAGQQNFRHSSHMPSHAPIVRSLSGSAPPDTPAPGPAYGQVSMQHAQIPNQQQGGNGGQQVEGPGGHAQPQTQQVEGQGVYGQTSMQHTQIQGQQVQNDGRQGAEAQGRYGQAPMYHAQMQSQQQGPNGGQQGGEGQGAYGQAPMQNTQMQSQHQGPNGGQNTFEGQVTYGQALMQHAAQSQQQGPNDGHQGVDGQGGYGQAQMQGQQQGPNGGQQSAEGQGAYGQAPMQHTQMQGQQQGPNGGQNAFEGQITYGQAPMQHAQVQIRQQGPNGGHQGAEGQGGYGQAQMQHTQMQGQQQGLNCGQQGAYGQAQMQHTQMQGQQQGPNGGQQGTEGQGAYGQAPIQHTHMQSQQQGPNGWQQGAEGQGAYGQAPMQHTQMQSQLQCQNDGQPDGQSLYHQASMYHNQAQQQPMQSGGQSGANGQQSQGPAPYMQASQSHGVQSQQGQNAAQGSSTPAPSQAPYAHQPQQQASVPPPAMGQSPQMQGNSGHVAGNYQAIASEPQGQAHFMQNSANGSSHSLQHHSLQQMQMGHNQGYQAGGQAQQQQLPPLPPPQSQGSSHPPKPPQQQSELMPTQPNTLQQQQQGAPPGVQQHILANVGGQQQPVVSAAGPGVSFCESSTTLPSQVPGYQMPVDESVPVESSSAIGIQLTAGSGDQVVSEDNHMNGVHGVPSVELDALDDELLVAELRKLDEDFQKNMMRAQRVFDTRMDNLARSQVQREVQHLKTLEKHEKERADFEKRRQQEETEQNRRIEQLQKDWASRREAMRQKQLAEAQAAESALSTSPTENSDVADLGGSSTSSGAQ